MAAPPSASLRTNHRLSFLSSKPKHRPPLSFLHLKSQPFNSSLHLNLRSKTHHLNAISSDLDISLLNPHCPSLKSRLSSGETLYGIFLLSFSPTLAEIAGLAGYDYVVVDMEHGPGGISEALQCLRVLASIHTPVILRVPEVSAAWTKKALDLGPQGIMFPNIESVSAAEMAVSYCRFPPRGVRGTAHTIVRASGYGLDDAYVSRCEEELLIMCQVETTTGIKEIEAIAAVEGVNVIQTGPLDLSASMGYLWDPGHKKVREMLKEAERRVLDVKEEGRSVYLGGFAMPKDPPEMLKQRGYHMVSGAIDVAMFRQAAVEDVKRFRSAGKNAAEEGEEKEDGYYSE
ncbi:2-keto-3-deoxy-L-rhamnonate aldolase [Rhynchospora pubera]|uniref:2-keto-3-deoxy-L-rhamnonate aldolase n=1 Tax=Rhynchospora pubera TaxID=906938 RepID=A0AAV8E8R9_9POAL|nr:2-keto-3-deoxy-L-rhamnonate aldolase [Rhynchospora pubera]